MQQAPRDELRLNFGSALLPQTQRRFGTALASPSAFAIDPANRIGRRCWTTPG
jgi:hypothetical protein